MAELLYGFYQLKDVLGNPVSEAMLPRISTAITATMTEYNRQLDTTMGLFVRRVSDYKLRYKSSLAKRLQPLDENGRARPTKNLGYYDIAFPIQSGGDAWGANFVTAQHITVQDLNDWMAESMTADKRWMADHILAALLTNTDWTFPDEGHGDLVIKPLANGDTQPYLVKVGAGQQVTDNHFLAQVDDIGDAHNPFPTIHRELVEHPENGGENATVIVFVSSDLMEDIEKLATYREDRDRDLTPGIGTDYLSATLTTPVPGIVRGKVSKCWIVEWASLPSGVMLATTAEGDKALGMREYGPESLRGFREMPASAYSTVSGAPYLERQFFRHAGFGAYNRVGALVFLVGSASYSVPTGYAAPIS